MSESGTGVYVTPESQYIHISSEFADVINNDTSSCTFTLKRPIISSDPGYALMIGLVNATIPHTWYNLYGTAWSFEILNVPDGTRLTGNIPNQNYTATQLAAAVQLSIQNALTAAGVAGVFTCTYNPATAKLTFIHDQYVFRFVQVANSVYTEIGMPILYDGAIDNYHSTFTAPYTLQSPGIVDLSNHHGIYICLSNTKPTLVSYNGMQYSQVLTRMPVMGTFTSIETYEATIIQYRLVNDDNYHLHDFTVQLRGDDGRLLQMNQVNWTMTLHAKFVKIESKPVGTQPGIAVSEQGAGFMTNRNPFSV